jgi:peroxiredoxin
VLNLLLGALCVALLVQNRSLKSGHTTALRPGQHVQAFGVRMMDGRTDTFRFDDSHRRYLLFVFSTTCPYCEESLPRIEDVVRTGAGPAIMPVAVSIHGPAETARFVVTHPISFRVVCADSSDEFQRRYEISGVPTTILIDGRGIVQKVWEGDVTADLAATIRAALARS